MNFIRLKDKIREGDAHFNRALKGRYAWWINMKWVVAMPYPDPEDKHDWMDINEYTTYERMTGRPPQSYYPMDSDNLQNYIDHTETYNINNGLYQKYENYNQYVTSEEVTTDMLKRFSAWLAGSIISLKNLSTNDEEYRMLYYYTDNTSTTDIPGTDYRGTHTYMNDSVIKSLNIFKSKATINTTATCSCKTASTVPTSSINQCDTILQYRLGVRNSMLSFFTKTDYWKDMPVNFLGVFRQYIEDIIKYNFRFYDANKISIFKPALTCPCSQTDDIQSQSIEILRRLSESLRLIISGQMESHRNYIDTAFSDWATYLYEIMYWGS